MSTNLSTSAARIDAVRTIGKGTTTTADAVAAILPTIPAGFDVKARGAVAGLVHDWAVGVGEKRPAVTLTVRDAAGEITGQTPTLYGTGVDTLTRAVKRALLAANSDDAPAVVNLLTRAGLKATREQVLAAWEAAQEANGADADDE